MSYSNYLLNEIKGYSEGQIRFILLKIMNYSWSDDLEDDFIDIINSEEFKGIQ